MKHRWEVIFISPKPPIPFEDKWFPANGIEKTIFKLQNFEFETNVSVLSVPLKNHFGDLPFMVTFYDTVGGELADWMEDWVLRVYPVNEYPGTVNHVTRLDNAVGKVVVNQLNGLKKVVKTKTLFIIPAGDMKYVGESVTGLIMYNQMFKIVGGGLS